MYILLLFPLCLSFKFCFGHNNIQMNAMMSGENNNKLKSRINLQECCCYFSNEKRMQSRVLPIHTIDIVNIHLCHTHAGILLKTTVFQRPESVSEPNAKIANTNQRMRCTISGPFVRIARTSGLKRSINACFMCVQ